MDRGSSRSRSGTGCRCSAPRRPVGTGPDLGRRRAPGRNPSDRVGEEAVVGPDAAGSLVGRGGVVVVRDEVVALAGDGNGRRVLGNRKPRDRGKERPHAGT